MNPIIKTAVKITEKLSQPNEKCNAKEDGIKTRKSKIGRVPKNGK